MGCKDTQNYYLRASNYSFKSKYIDTMKQKFSSLFVLLVLLLTGLQVSAQSTPKPFDIEQPSLRVFLPAPELATGRAVVACPGGGYSGLGGQSRRV